MCLQTITKRVEKPSKKVMKAWKVFYVNFQGGLENYYVRFKSHPAQGRWIKAEEEEIYTSNHTEKYLSGFHCYVSKEQALKFHNRDTNLVKNAVLLEVKVKEITTYGTQWKCQPCDIIVARQMFVPKQSKQNKLSVPTSILRPWPIAGEKHGS